MIKRLMSLLGYKEYLVEITWDSSGEKEIIPIKAWSPMKAITNAKITKDVVNKAEMSIINQPNFGSVRYINIKDKMAGVAMKKTE